jgi:hypothetical protein
MVIRLRIVGLTRQNGELVADPDRLVAEVDIDKRRKTVHLNVVNKVYEEGLRGVFPGPVRVFVGGGTNPDDGIHFDALQAFLPWDKGYMNALSQSLREQSLRYIRVDRGFFGRMRGKERHR